jgi:hypothetical protein
MAVTTSSHALAGPDDAQLPRLGPTVGSGRFSVSRLGGADARQFSLQRFGPIDGTGVERFGSTVRPSGGTVPGFSMGTPTNGAVRFPGGIAFGRFCDPSRFRFFTGVPFASPSAAGAEPTYFTRGRYNGMLPPPLRFRAPAALPVGPTW